jgi:hypothetical protein
MCVCKLVGLWLQKRLFLLAVPLCSTIHMNIFLLNPQSEKSVKEEEKNPKDISEEATKHPKLNLPEVNRHRIKLKLVKPLVTTETEVTKSSEVAHVVLKKKIRQRTSRHFDVSSSSSSDEDNEKDNSNKLVLYFIENLM